VRTNRRTACTGTHGPNVAQRARRAARRMARSAPGGGAGTAPSVRRVCALIQRAMSATGSTSPAETSTAGPDRAAAGTAAGHDADYAVPSHHRSSPRPCGSGYQPTGGTHLKGSPPGGTQPPLMGHHANTRIAGSGRNSPSAAAPAPGAPPCAAAPQLPAAAARPPAAPPRPARPDRKRRHLRTAYRENGDLPVLLTGRSPHTEESPP
jgi:hypothetical protein